MVIFSGVPMKYDYFLGIPRKDDLVILIGMSRKNTHFFLAYLKKDGLVIF